MVLINAVRQWFVETCLRLAGYEHLLQVIELQKASLVDIQKQKNLKTASFEVELMVNSDNKSCSRRVFFYSPDNELNNLFLESYASLCITQFQTFLMEFGDDFPGVCRTVCCGLADNVIKFPTRVDDCTRYED